MNASTSLVDDLFSQLQGAPLQQIAGQLGTDTQQASAAVGAALPMLLGALGRNAQQPQGAADLFGALQRDHAGGGMDLGGLLGSLLGGGAGAGGAASQPDAGGILGHIFGGAQSRAESGLGQATGLGGAQVSQLLRILAPIVMSFLAQRTQQGGGMDAGGLGSMLGQESSRIQDQGGAAGGLLGAVLDQNGDGKLDLGDLLKAGGSLLGGRR
ncbi:DUF937 domain-containing protein [Xenophilus arseniciresistens]|uniref:DUF937 domain-containing protein n=1 Tax=Xenophilus arseniciresistens TaxID=1283306 RepID=A0AAE3SZ48_9BURK|nr:DUF937 domain-containing protein [Xenophilus arseniciresistens]MDA7416180.1 DUF937 domain-containing protein [Xenophilus arseniciresistens]